MGRSRSWRFPLRLALRELRNDPRFAWFFGINLALGLSGFVMLDALEVSVAAELNARSRAFLGADIAVQSSRPLLDEERSALDALADAEATSDWVEMFSMASGTGAQRGRARLVEIRAIDANFPLYGQLVVDRGFAPASRAAPPGAARSAEGPVEPAQRSRLSARTGAWVDGLVFAQLAVGLGDVLKIGSQAFEIQHRVVADAGRVGTDFGLAPRIYIALDRLGATGLVATGSRVGYRRLYRLAEARDAEATADRMRDALGDPAVRIVSHTAATRQLARGFAAVNDYLGLISLIAVFLAGLGASHLFREFLSRRLKDIAILLCLGATRARAQVVYGVQIWLLALAAALSAGLLATLCLTALAAAAPEFAGAAASARVGARSLALAIGLALAASSAACLPLLVRIGELRPAQLFIEQARPGLESRRDLLLMAPALALFWVVAVWRVDDVRIGSLFAGLFSLALVVLGGVGRGLLRALDGLPPPSRIAARLALRHLSKARASALGGFVSIALCAFLVGIAPQLQHAIRRDLDPPDAGRLPSLFLFDIQPGQLQDLAAHVAERGLELQKPSPLVRARLVSLGGAPADPELRARSYNLTYPLDSPSGPPHDSERLAAGTSVRDLPASAGQSETAPAPVSLEARFAERLGVGIGDALEFDVQGVEVFGRISGLREVQWNSLQPNFFVEFGPGALEQAPQTLLASLPALPDGARERLQASIVDRFPNVSAIDVTASVRRALTFLERLQWALQSTASASLVVGMLLLYAVARDQARARRGETNLLKVLGAEFRTVRSAVDIEFGLLGGLATGLGSALGVAASALLARFGLDANWSISWLPLIGVGIAFPTLCVATARLATAKVLRESPLALLQAAEA